MVFWIPIAAAVAAAAGVAALLSGGDDDKENEEEQQATKAAVLLKNRTKRNNEVRQFATTHQLKLNLRGTDSSNDSPAMIIKALNQAVQQRTDMLNLPVRALDKDLEELSKLSSQLQNIQDIKHT